MLDSLRAGIKSRILTALGYSLRSKWKALNASGFVLVEKCAPADYASGYPRTQVINFGLGEAESTPLGGWRDRVLALNLKSDERRFKI